MAAIHEHLHQQGATLALVEFQIWAGDQGRQLIVPHIPFRTEVLRQRVITDYSGVPLQIAPDGEADDPDPVLSDPDRTAPPAEPRTGNRAFWQAYIDTARYDHPDQPPPRHGGNNWVKLPLPAPAGWLTGYRYKDSIGMSLVTEQGSTLYQTLALEKDEFLAETGLADLRFRVVDPAGPIDRLGLSRPLADFPDEAAQLAWLGDVGNRLITALRARISG